MTTIGEMTRMNELLPCPFCGAKAEVERSQERFDYSVNGGPDSVKDYGYYVYCTSCDASMGLINVPPNDSDEAIANWNRRAGAPPVLSSGGLYIIKKALQRYRTRIEEVGAMGWYDSPSVTNQELARVDAILAELEPAQEQS